VICSILQIDYNALGMTAWLSSSLAFQAHRPVTGARRRFRVLLQCTCIVLLMLSVPWTRPALSQPVARFSTCATGTGTDATIIIPADASLSLGSDLIAVGDELAVFTPEGHCAGSITWTGSNRSLTVWGQDAFFDAGKALSPGDPMTFRAWDASSGREVGGESAFSISFSAREAFYTTENRFVPNGIYVVDSLHLSVSPHAAR
jgi:hypothetical protein